MRRMISGFGVVVGMLLIWTIPWVSDSVFGQASAEAPHPGEGGVPQFQLDPNWPRVPAKWRMGFGSAVTGDGEGNVWIFSRPATLAHPRSTAADTTSASAPPVMEFDQAGTFIQGWGGQSGPGYQWPSNEHGLTVDSKGFVWVVGNVMAPGGDNARNLPNDNQVIKFTKTGKFVMAIGKSGQNGSNKTEVLKGATSVAVYAKTNEVFVSDGYGNSRVMVYDADTGKFKRMWGAYGHKPLDMEDRPKRSAPTLNPFVAMAEVLQQFDTVHDVKVSNDGLVYVFDREHKRVQVFTLDGKYIKEQFLGLDNAFHLAGARGAAFSADPEQKFLYLGGAPVVWILNRKTLEILGSFKTGDLGQGAAFEHPPGHQIGSDNKGNVYVVQAELTGANGKSGGTGAYKWLLTGYSPTKKCCEGGVVGTHGTGTE